MKIALDHVVKDFPGHRAVRGVSLEIGSGELVALLGPSGSGKTTMLRMVAGLEQPDGGRILFGGEDAAAMAVSARRVGFVFQHYALFPHMRVAENVAFGLEVSKARRSRAEIDARVAELLRLVQLEGLGGRYPAQISGGQRQRVALARALAVEPRVLLLDEPFGALDAQVRRDLRRWLREIHDRLAVTTLFVTHDRDEALDLADRIVILKDGVVVQQGTPQEVCRDPASAFVMRFLGDTNRLAAEIRGGVAHPAGAVACAPLPAPGLPDGPAQIHVRPGDLGWARSGAGVPVRVARVIDRPDSRRIVAETESGEALEMDVPPGTAVARHASGVAIIRDARIFPGLE